MSLLLSEISGSPNVLPMWINGEWTQAASGDVSEVIDPATTQVIAKVPRGAGADVTAAIRAARKAFDQGPWRDVSTDERQRILAETATRIREHADEIAELETRNVGKPIADSRAGVAQAAARFDYYADLIGGWRDADRWHSGDKHFVVHEPIGVIGQIIPWNYPVTQAAGRLATSIAAGTTCVMKPSRLVPLSTLALGRLIDKAGIPPGVVNIVTGSGSEVGAELARNPDVDMIVLIGSTETGIDIVHSAASTMKKLSLELGGKSPNIVFADADLDAAVEGAAAAIFANAGQNCAAGSRLILEEKIHAAFLDRLIERVRSIRLGPGIDPETDMGPLISAQQRDQVEGWIKQGLDEGARLAIGGSRPDGVTFSKGFFLQPTIFDGVMADMRIAQEEIFGPVLAVLTFRDEAEAIAIANNSRYGLAGAVWTRDPDRGKRVLRQLRVGITWLNTYFTCPLDAPWGGYKQSGIGRVLGKYEFEEYLETKQVNIA